MSRRVSPLSFSSTEVRPPRSRVGVVEGALGGPEQVAAIAALFPNVAFETLDEAWPRSRETGPDIIIVGANASAAAEVDGVIRRMKACAQGVRVVVVLRSADVATSRRLSREGVADVLPSPVSEPALALSLERLLSQTPPAATGGPARSGEIIAILKAGGGVGASALASQVAVQLARGAEDRVCLADLDLQFGAISIYLDLPNAVTIADLLAGTSLAETALTTALAKHRSGARVLGAPHELMALESLASAQIDTLIKRLRRDFATTLIDLPSVWTAWTNRVLTHSDRIVLVTQLSVPHIQLVQKQLRMLGSQRLDNREILLVCNALTSEQQSSVPLKAAEKALGRPFDAVIPDDRRVMMDAINQGVEVSAVKRGTKLEKAISALAARLQPATADAARERR
ncbi:MAG TPA: AAA family ATPase [Caulobacteraceae bacterium]